MTLLSLLIVAVCVLAELIVDKLSQRVLKIILKRVIEHDQHEKFKGMMVASLQKPLHVLSLTLGSALGLVIIDTPSWGETLFSIVFSYCAWLSHWVCHLVCVELTEEFIKNANQGELN